MLEAHNVFYGGTTEAINALVIVTYHADVSVTARQKLCQLILSVVGILILINHNITELSLIILSDITVLL